MGRCIYKPSSNIITLSVGFKAKIVISNIKYIYILIDLLTHMFTMVISILMFIITNAITISSVNAISQYSIISTIILIVIDILIAIIFILSLIFVLFYRLTGSYNPKMHLVYGHSCPYVCPIYLSML